MKETTAAVVGFYDQVEQDLSIQSSAFVTYTVTLGTESPLWVDLNATSG